MDSIVKKAAGRTKSFGFESHHVIPRSMGGTVTVYLTCREHFIVHWLLMKCVEAQFKSKMVHAFWRMTFTGSTLQRSLSSAQYEAARRNYSLMMSESQLGKPSKRKDYTCSEETRAKFRAARARNGTSGMKGRKHSEETREKMRIARLANPFSAMKGRKHTPEAREKMRIAKIGNKNRLGGNKWLAQN